MAEFIGRCLKTEGVSLEQAQAFQSKFWRLHFDSSHRKDPTTTTRIPCEVASSGSGSGGREQDHRHLLTEDEKLAYRMERLDCSEDIETDPVPASSVPFKERIRPGMVVRCDYNHHASPSPGEKVKKYYRGAPLIQAADGRSYNLFVVLCPAAAVGERVRDIVGDRVRVNPSSDSSVSGSGLQGSADDSADHEDKKFLCAVVSPGLLAGSYTVSLWRQVVVRLADMDAEVLMEFDVATRYYYLTV